MKKLALMAVNRWLSYLLVSLQLVASIVLILGTLESVHAAEFFCPSGDVTCLIAAINNANGMPGEHVINLEPGSYTLQTIDNMTDGQMGYRRLRVQFEYRQRLRILPLSLSEIQTRRDFAFFMYLSAAN